MSALLQSNYPISEILVIDDGSTDDTAMVVESASSANQKVRLIKKENGGKSSALNLGVEKAVGEIIVTIDADTVFTEQAISHLVSNFRDTEIAGVSGNCKIGNIRNQLTLWQHIY